jgi:transcriptional regulator with XRE-family HTH domain
MVTTITTHPLNPTTFANRLVTARKQAGLTQNALADAAGLHVSNIRRYEAGTNQPTIDALRNLALALATSTDQLLFEPHEREPDNDLALAFEAASTRLDDEGRQHLKATLEGLLLRTEARRWAS